MQLASASGEAQVLRAAKQGLGAELERMKGENRDLLQKAALLDSLSAEAEALRHQVCLLLCCVVSLFSNRPPHDNRHAV